MMHAETKRILIVEDEKNVVDLLALNLRESGAPGEHVYFCIALLIRRAAIL